uniref:Uncharacterized protein n=1 Tax=Oryza nivara TaxID=4536 RepID=A0A0E0G5U0_ORYNI
MLAIWFWGFLSRAPAPGGQVAHVGPAHSPLALSLLFPSVFSLSLYLFPISHRCFQSEGEERRRQAAPLQRWLRRARSSFLQRVLSSSLRFFLHRPHRAAAPASPAPKGINVPARPRPAGLLPFASLCSRYDHRPTARGRPHGAASPPALVRHPPPVRRLLGPLSKPDPPLPPPQRHLPPPHPTPSLFLPSRPLPLTSPSPRSRSFRLSLPDFPLSVANRGAEPLPSFALPSAQSTERQRLRHCLLPIARGAAAVAAAAAAKSPVSAS